jgi:hypothetical protein
MGERQGSGADKKAMGDLGGDSCLRFRFVGGGAGTSNWSALGAVT